MNNKTKILFLLILVLIIVPSVQATYQKGWFGEEKRVESVNYSIAQIEDLFTEVGGVGIDFHISEQNNFEPTKYDASINLYEISPEEIGISKHSFGKVDFFKEYSDEIIFNETINEISMYSFRRPYVNPPEYYTYGVYEKDGHLYALTGYHGANEVNHTTLLNDAELFKEILDSIERKN